MFFCLCRKNYTVPYKHRTSIKHEPSQDFLDITGGDMEENQEIPDKESAVYKNYDDELLNATWSNTSPYIPCVNYGRVIKCYDGDSCTIVAKLYPDEPVYRFSLRLNGIDAPELRSKNVNEKYAAHHVKTKISEKILNKYVNLKNVKMDKYGRILCDIYFNNENINEWLINNRYAVKYDGGTKVCPDDWCSYIGIKLKNDYINE